MYQDDTNPPDIYFSDDDNRFEDTVLCDSCDSELDNQIQIYKLGGVLCEQCYWERREE